MQLILNKVEEKHLALIIELAKALNIDVIEGVENDSSYLEAMEEAKDSPLLNQVEKDVFLKSLQDVG